MVSLEENKKLAHRLHQEIIQNLDLDLADEIIAPDCVFHGPTRDARTSARGPEMAKQMARYDAGLFDGAFSFKHTDTLAEGNLVAFRWIVTGTRKTVTGGVMSGNGLDIIRIENGKVAEVWAMWDRIALEELARGEGRAY